MSETPTRHFTHIHRDPWLYQHPEPPRAFHRELADLLKYSTRMDALKEFLNQKNLKTLHRLKGHIISFGDHDMFGQMIVECECTEAELMNAIVAMMRPEGRSCNELSFVREDIYDTRAWCHLLLSDFVSFTGKIITKEGYNAARPPECMPVMHFAVRHKVWDVDRTCFKVERRQKHYKQIALMNFHHPQLNGRFEEHDGVCRRWVGEMEIPEGQTLKQIEPLLFAEVEKECAKHYVRVNPCWQTRRLQGDEPLELGYDYKAKIHVP